VSRLPAPHPPFCLQWYPGENVGQGKDYTLFSTIEGIVIYQKRPDRDSVSTLSSSSSVEPAHISSQGWGAVSAGRSEQLGSSSTQGRSTG
jgi:hypothetical protein